MARGRTQGDGRPETRPPRRTMWHLALLGLVGVLALEAFAPFRPDVPGFRANGAHPAKGAIRFDGPNRAFVSRPERWLAQAQAGAPFTISLRASAARHDVPDVARLLTVSRDYYRADIMVAQYEDDLIVRIRRRGADESGEPPIRVPDVFRDRSNRHIVVRRDGASIVVLVDGREAGAVDLGEPGLRSWSTDYRLALGDEHVGSRSWHGMLTEAVVQAGGRRRDYLAGGLSVPSRFWYLPDRVRNWARPDSIGDVRIVVAHGLVFVPVGALVVLSNRRRRGRRALLGVAAISALLLAGKICFAGRHPLVFDLLAELAGGAVGVAAAVWIPKKRHPPSPFPARVDVDSR